jgi:hypothetical protein
MKKIPSDMQANTTTDKSGREWIHPTPLRYYVHQFERNAFTKPTDYFIGKWVVIDARTDLAVTKFWKSKRGALNEFMRAQSSKKSDRIAVSSEPWFGDIPLKNALIAWNTQWEVEPWQPGKVVVIPYPDHRDHCSRLKLANTTGACWVQWGEMTNTQRLCKLFIEAWHMVCRDGVEPKTIHEAFSVIPEYRAIWSGEQFFCFQNTEAGRK